MTRLIRRALIAMVAASAGIVLHGQPTTAGNALFDRGGIDLDIADLGGIDLGNIDLGNIDLGGVDASITVLDQPILDLGIDPPAVGDILDRPPILPLPILPLPGLPLPALPLPQLPLPAPPVPDNRPPPVPPMPDPDVGGPVPPSTVAPSPVPDVVTPPPAIDDDGTAPVPEPAGSGTAEPNPGPARETGPDRTAISGVADDVETPATGDGNRDVLTAPVAPLPKGVGVTAAPPAGGPSAAIPAVSSPLSHDSIVVEPRGPRGTTGAVGESRGDTAVEDPPVETTRSWVPTTGATRGLPLVALGAILALVTALWIVVAAIRRAITRFGRWADGPVDHRREPGRVSADTRPTSREPTSRVSADTRPIRREPTSRVSADTRPVRREPRSGVGGRSVDARGRDRRVPRTPPARCSRARTPNRLGRGGCRDRPVDREVVRRWVAGRRSRGSLRGGLPDNDRA